jgi:hypothetical protein
MRHVSWFEFGLALFAGALPVGVLLVVAAPLEFFHAVGAAIVAMGLIGLWISVIGLKLEDPQRWAQIRASLFRFSASSPRHPIEH